MRLKPRPVRKASGNNPEREVARVINQGWSILTAGAMADAAQEAAAAGSMSRFVDALPWEELVVHLGKVIPPLEQVAHKGSVSEVGVINASLSLNAVDELSRRYVQQEAGILIVDITQNQRATIREVLGRAFSGELTKDQAAREIRRGIGLHPKWAAAVQNFEARQNLLERPKGYSAERWAQTIQKRTDTYHNRLLRRRADLIARTEIITAENLGRYATWADSIAKGHNGADSRKEWSPGPNACPQCTNMAGETVRWDQQFSNGISMPPAHPGCRCTAQLLPAPYVNPALATRPIDWLNPFGDRETLPTR